MGNALATIDPKEFRTFLEGRRNTLERISGKMIDPDKVVQTVIFCMTKNPALMGCTRTSVMRSVLQACEMGLVPGAGNGDGYLIPYGKECTFIPGYQGLVRLTLDSEYVVCIDAVAVYEGDEFRIERGLYPNLIHIPGRCTDPKKLTDVYVVWQTKHNTRHFERMTREEVDAIRARSKAGSNGPWVTDYAAMARKTVIRRASKLWPKSRAMEKALALDNAHDTGDYSLASFDLPEAQPEPVQKAIAEERVSSARKNMRKGTAEASSETSAGDAEASDAPSEPAPAPAAKTCAGMANRIGETCPACGAEQGEKHLDDCDFPAPLTAAEAEAAGQSTLL
jgi:recombination protein RecT